MLLLGILLLLLASACFSGAEAALFTLASRPPRQHSHLVSRMLEKRAQALTVILLTNLVVNLSFFASTYALAKPYSLSQSAMINAAAVLLIVLFGEIAPKLIAHRHPLTFSKVSLPIVQLCYWILAPLLRFLPQVKLTEPKAPQPIQSSVAVDLLGDTERVLGHDEETFLSRFLELGELRAGALRRPLQNYLQVAPHLPLSLALRRMASKKVPWAVVVDERDQVIGILDRTRRLRGSTVGDAMHSVPILPEVAPVASGLELLKNNGGPMLLLVDEYGDSAGVIERGRWADTLLNRLPQSHASETMLIEQLSDSHYRLNAALALHEFADKFGEAQDIDVRVDTLAGFVQEKLGRIAIAGDAIEMQTTLYHLKLTVLEASATRVLTIELEVQV
ncbi:MAG: putative hemolysin [Myxococcota bacterium]